MSGITLAGRGAHPPDGLAAPLIGALVLIPLSLMSACPTPVFVDGPTPTPGDFALTLREATDDVCSDGLDNDGDGHADCDDRACVYTSTVSVCGGEPSVESTDSACSDGISNDDDSLIDCQDDNCYWNANVSVCDRDRDGSSPAEGDCFDHPTLDMSLAVGVGVPEMCGDGEDNDCDGVAEEAACINLDLGLREVRVLDGDTVSVEGLGSARFKGIDTPETWEESTGTAECYGREAEARTEGLVGDGPLRLVLDPVDFRENFRDLYGRLLVHVYTEDGAYLNGILVEEGYACVWERFECFNKVELLTLQSDAQEAGAGLWAACGASVCF